MDGGATGGRVILNDRPRAGRSPESDKVKALRRDVRLELAALLRVGSGHLADGVPGVDARRGAVQYTCRLWFFSALADYQKSAQAVALAGCAADYLHRHFTDPDHGGLYWEVDAAGQVTDARKHAFVQAAGIHAFVEYARVTGDTLSLRTARDLQRELEERFWDRQRGGYLAAMSAFWHAPADQRLSPQDPDCPKTAMVHLRIVEAYAHLHRVAPTDMSHAALHRALGLFIDRFADVTRGHLCLFYSLDWESLPDHSFGHDIAASWRLWDAAVALGDREMQARVRAFSLSLAAAARDEGRQADGRLRGDDWAQAEGLTGFVAAWQLSGNPAYLDAAVGLWPHAQTAWQQNPCLGARALIEIDSRLKGQSNP